MTTTTDTLSEKEKRQIELDHLMDKAEETSETIMHGKNAHPATLFGYEINTLEKELEKFGEKK